MSRIIKKTSNVGFTESLFIKKNKEIEFDIRYLSPFDLKALSKFKEKWKGDKIKIPIKYVKR